jgi:hypothetical protein
LLAWTKRSAEALESLRTIALVWSVIAALVAVTWVIFVLAAGR